MAFRESRQLGHSITIAERCYVGLLRGIPNTARTVEAAMRIVAGTARSCGIEVKG